MSPLKLSNSFEGPRLFDIVRPCQPKIPENNSSEEFLHGIFSNESSTPKQKADALKLLRLNNFSETISLTAYCLMGNHFHFLVKQTMADGIDKFMNSLMTRYTMYFNRRHKRVGHLFQGNYKAVLVETEAQLLHLTRYIHQNPASKGHAFQTHPYSSYQQYVSSARLEWIKPDEVLNYFSKQGFNSYAAFVGDTHIYDSLMIISGLTLSESD
ncbi:MAG: hypothetical protein UY06_C0007G0010 [Candidatus Amesbacteria bacterium GW2011_GWA2_47_70]|nr:MAG: hypothetical protein UY06_C0007G0010 [Candidatus Amesbacteria bacterium GW2011_GWA2_47_70]